MKENKLLFQILVNYDISFKVCKYLTIDDISSLSLTSSSVNSLLKSNNIKERFLLKASTNYIYLYSNKFEIINETKIRFAWEKSDELYRRFYSQSHFMIKCYYFSFILLGLDLYSLLVAIDLKTPTNWITQLPFIFQWIISIIFLAVYVVRYKSIKNKMKHLIQKEIIQSEKIYQNEKQMLAKKLKLRMKNKKPMAFEKISASFIIFYFPIIVKLSMEKIGSSYRKAFWASSSLFFAFLLFHSIFKIIRKKCKHKIEKKDKYKQLYRNGKGDFFKEKMKAISSEEKRSYCGEVTSFFTFFISKIILYLILILYLDSLGAKFDDYEDSYSWFALFSPLYIALFFLFAWGILYSYSIRKYLQLVKGQLYISVVIIILSLFVNCILIPFKLEKIIKISNFWFFGNFILATLGVFYHYYLIKKYTKLTF